MRIFKLFLLGISMSVIIHCTSDTPPRAKKQPHELTIHGDTRIDNYYWLKERDNPTVIKYLEVENAWREKVMARTGPFEEKLFQEMKSRIKEDDASVPAKRGDYWYYVRYEKGMEYPIYCRTHGSLQSGEEILLNVNDLAKDHDFCQVRGFKTSPDHNIAAFAVDFFGRRKYTLRFIDLHSGQFLADEIPEMTGNFVWANDNKTVFYARQHPETLRWDKIFRHALGGGKDALVYFEEDETYDASIGKTLDDAYLVIHNGSTLQTENLILNADFPKGDFTPFLKREPNHEYSIEHGGDRWFILTNDGAKNFKLMQTPDNNTAKEFWTTVVDHNPDALLQDVTVFKNWLIVDGMRNALPFMRIIDRRSGATHEIDFGESVFAAFVDENLEYDANVLRYSFQSMKTPNSVYDYNLATREKVLKKQQPVLGGFDAANYVTERVWAAARDGVKAPMSLLYKKGLQHNGENPVLIYAYGSYGYSMSPYFSSKRFSLVDRGFIYAIAHIRGGSELGRQWYEDGRQLKKKNTFTDFIDCTQFLVDEKYTSPQHIYAQGGSAGGLLMGAVANMAPQLYNGIIAEVPFVDVVTTMLDDSIPLTTAEYDEWGNPNEKEFYDYMLSYSPYDNVEAKAYPNMFITAGLHDSQVQYWEPAKWVAKLRELKTDDNLLLLYTNMEAGHGGASGRFQALKEDAMLYTFLLMLEGKVE